MNRVRSSVGRLEGLWGEVVGYRRRLGLAEESFRVGMVEERRGHGRVQGDLARELGVSVSMVSMWESGRRRVGEETWVDVMRVFRKWDREVGGEGDG